MREITKNNNGGSIPLDARVAVLETEIKHIDVTLSDIKLNMHEIRNRMSSNFLWLLGIFGAGFIMLFGALAHGFKWI